ncbi:hypothetical protein MTF66_02755 [Pseudoalteromonas sp. 2CM39R]|uniref:hypothetical protein n=1 Tax=Pseudoalteromonas sp. 2CM39R TaxID=2929856 RepID=UPI0020C0E59F|nr:hypothetical protein [Pseudoalteromonas sp. 2CM39R]MCK8123903.1 hypothetical protein [Pseudoalteromonas sp. 2CM39R]
MITLVFWSSLGMFLASEWWGALPVILFVLVPISALVSYRSSVLAKCLIEGNATVKLYAIDGFKWAFIASAIFWLWSISSQAMAAGGPLLGANWWQVMKYIFTISIPVSLIVGFIGGAHGVVFFYLNSWQITANKQINAD